MIASVADGVAAGGSAPTPGAGGASAPRREHRAIPEATVARLTTYLRVLTRPDTTDAAALRSDDTISSEELAALAGVNSAKLRKDLSYLGSQGTRGVGYDAAALRTALERALGAHEVYPVAVAGVGHLGSALAGYVGFGTRGFPVRVLLDADPQKIGDTVAGVTVSDIREAVDTCRREDVVIGVIATPEIAAQRVADVFVSAGIRSILNFSPGRLTVSDDVIVRRVDLALELQLLAFHEMRRALPNAGPSAGHEADRQVISR